MLKSARVPAECVVAPVYRKCLVSHELVVSNPREHAVATPQEELSNYTLFTVQSAMTMLGTKKPMQVGSLARGDYTYLWTGHCVFATSNRNKERRLQLHPARSPGVAAMRRTWREEYRAKDGPRRRGAEVEKE